MAKRPDVTINLKPKPTQLTLATPAAATPPPTAPDTQPTAPAPARASAQARSRTRQPRNVGDPVRNAGIALRESELAALAGIAARLNISRNAVIAWCVRYCLKLDRGGQLPIEQSTRQQTITELMEP